MKMETCILLQDRNEKKKNKTDNACQVADISMYTNTVNLKSNALNHQGNNTMYKVQCVITTEYGSGV